MYKTLLAIGAERIKEIGNGNARKRRAGKVNNAHSNETESPRHSPGGTHCM